MRFRLAIAAVVCAASPVVAQQRAMTNADYARAERYMSYNTAPLVAGGAVRPTWLAGDRFVYRVAASDSSGDVMIVDPVRGTRARLLDDAKLAAAVAAALGTTADAIRQPSTKNRLSTDGRMVVVSLGGRSVSCDVATTRCDAAVEDRAGARTCRGGARADDVVAGWHAARSSATGICGCATSRPARKRSSTSDGVKDFGYATDNAGWTQQRPRRSWCGRPTRRRSRRSSRTSASVGEMYLVDTQRRASDARRRGSIRCPATTIVTMIQRVVIDVDAADGRPAADAARPASLDAVRRRRVPRRRLGRRAVEPGRLARSRSCRRRAITSSEQLRVADAATGAVRDVLEETVATFFESGNGRVNWRYLPASNEVIWFSRARQLGPALPLRPARPAS